MTDENSDGYAARRAAMEKLFGKNDPFPSITNLLDSGYDPLNYAISGRYDGGFPGGRIVEIFGPESSGKTWLATQAMISAQRAGGIAGFHDHERSFLPHVGESLGLEIDPAAFMFEKPDTFEGSISNFIKKAQGIRASKIIAPNAPMCWVFDSLATMIPQDKFKKDVTELNMNDMTMLARVSSQILPVLANVAEKTNTLVIILNQMRLKPGVVYGDPNTTPGGNALKFHATTRIQLGATRLTRDENGEKVMYGQQVTARCVKNKGARPFMMAKWSFLFGDDGIGRFDVAGSLIDFATNKKLLTKAGSRVEWTDGKTYYPTALARKLEAEGKVGELTAMIRASGVTPDEDRRDEDEIVILPD
jgi:recombination protein RecA